MSPKQFCCDMINNYKINIYPQLYIKDRFQKTPLNLHLAECAILTDSFIVEIMNYLMLNIG